MEARCARLFSLLVLAAALISSSEACKWLNDIQEKVVDFEVQSKGFHRDYVAHVHIASMNRFMDCSLALRVTVPKGAFVDTVNLESSLDKHCFSTQSHFDVELPEFSNSTKEQEIVFYLDRPVRKLFIIEDKLTFPVHLRYHEASESAAAREVTFKPPEAFVSCRDNATTIFADQNCQRFTHKLPCNCGVAGGKGSTCEYVRVGVQPRRGPVEQSVQLPVGDKSVRFPVAIGTIAFVFVVVGCLLTSLLPSSSDLIKKSN